MLDIKLIRENPDLIRADLRKRKDDEKLKLLEDIIADDANWRQKVVEVDQLKAQRNKMAGEVAQLKKSGDDASSQIAKMQEIKGQIETHDIRKIVRFLEFIPRGVLRSVKPDLTGAKQPVVLEDHILFLELKLFGEECEEIVIGIGIGIVIMGKLNDG